MSNHTATPWEVSPDKITRRFTVRANNRKSDADNAEYIQSCLTNCADINPEAVPDLLAALGYALPVVALSPGGSQTLAMIQAAIEKAKGRL